MKIFLSTKKPLEKIDTSHNEPFIVMIQDHIATRHTVPWDDFDFIIMFNIYIYIDKQRHDIGMTRVLFNGEKNTAKYLFDNGIKINDSIYDVGAAFKDDSTVSLPTDIEFYQKLNKIFTDNTNRIEALKTLCDASYNINRLKEYKEWDGFNKSVLRDSNTAEAILAKGYQIAVGRYTPTESFNIEIPNLSSETIDPITLRFDNTDSINKSNINLLIGKNGVGKSFVLNELSKIIIGATQIDDSWPYFNKLITVAYSPFEKFYELTKANQSKRHRINVNEYSYIGYRNKDHIFDVEWPKIVSFNSLMKILNFDCDNQWWIEKERFDTLSETLSMCINFDYLGVLTEEDEIIEIIKRNRTSIREYIKLGVKSKGMVFIKDGELVPLSSGQLIYSYMIPAIVAELSDESLIIIDEPELYLHPSMEIELIKMLKYLLHRTNSYAVIATHSSIIAREVGKNSINILRKTNNHTQVCNPSIETFGATLETIIGEVFDDYYTTKPYQSELNELLSDGSVDDAFLSQVSSRIGDEALAYLISKKVQTSDIDVEIDDRE